MDSSHQNKYPNDNEAAVGEASRTASSPAVENSDSAMEKFRTGDYLPLNVSEEPKDRSSRTGGLNRKALLTFMVIVVVAVAIISLTVIFVVYSGSGKDADSKKQRRSERRYQFDDMLNWTFNPIIPRGEKWISDDSVITVDERAIIIHNASTDKITELFSDEQLKALRINNLTYFSLSPDGAWMLFAVDKKKKYRYSSVARYLAVDVKTRKQVTNISTSGSSTQSLIQYISWGSRNSIVFVSGSDIYWIKSIEKPDPIKVTSSGSEKIFNGIPDWVYEEEILGQRPAVVISPDEKHLSYATFNDTEVRPFEISLYGDPNAAYTRVQDIAYPKPGFSNPYVQIYIYSVDQKKEIELKPPSDISESDFYFTNLVWASKTIVSVTWMNRAQNVSIVMLCSVHKGFCVKNYQLVVPDGWLSQNYPDPFFSSDGGYYLQLLPKTEGENGEFLHVAKVASIKNANNEIKFLTAGQWEVKKIISLDEKNGVVYYESSETSPTQSHLYSVNLDGKNKRCLSCELNETKGKTNIVPGSTSIVALVPGKFGCTQISDEMK